MKRILFAAFLASFAIGGAIKANANIYYNQGSNTPIDCETGVPSCADQKTGSDFYRLPASNPGGQGDAVSEEEYDDLAFQP